MFLCILACLSMPFIFFANECTLFAKIANGFDLNLCIFTLSGLLTCLTVDQKKKKDSVSKIDHKHLSV